MNETRLILLHALTPLHVGTGQAVGNVDLPIAREKATGFPIVPASALKGVLRDYFSTQSWATQAFGDTDQAGAWVFTDLRILCLPMRSFFGVFAYATCPLILEQLRRRAEVFGVTGFENLSVAVDGTQIALTSDSALQRDGKVYLEDLDLTAKELQAADAVARAIADKLLPEGERSHFMARFAVVANDVFTFLSETATEVVARVRLEDDTKTVASGGLWYEEAVPAEAVFYGFVGATSEKPSLASLQIDQPLQIGGDATIGRGLCKVVIAP
ncbi:MAG: type III-B CRISPR module RAMP protein Cmr4 [Armatimonadetes bacterium]|nr:type III-B CRISPR module RAMP protein Cmr4 [Armatimonadota bacterium]